MQFDLRNIKPRELEEAFDDGTKDLDKADHNLWEEIDQQMDIAIDAAALLGLLRHCESQVAVLAAEPAPAMM